MNFYKLESTYNTIPTAGFSPDYPHEIVRSKKITLKWFVDSYDKMEMRLNAELNAGGKVAVRTISQAEYIRGLER